MVKLEILRHMKLLLHANSILFWSSLYTIPGQFRGLSLGHISTRHCDRTSSNERPWEWEEGQPPDAGRSRGEGSRCHPPASHRPNDIARPRLPRDQLLAAAGEGSEHSMRCHLRTKPWREVGEAGPPAHHIGEEAGASPPPHHEEQGEVGRPRPLHGQGPPTCACRKRRRQPHGGRVV